MLSQTRMPEKIPLDIVGSNTFGRYAKTSIAQTFNMIISDNNLVPFAGYKVKAQLDASLVGGKGRGLYVSSSGNFMIAVVNGSVFRVEDDLTFANIGTLATASGTVWIVENDNKEIVISDNVNLYIYSYTDLGGVFSTSNSTVGFTIDFIPGYLAFQNARIICIATSPSSGKTTWRLSDFNNGFSWPNDAAHVGAFQSKISPIQAGLKMPGNGNVLILFATTGAEQWTDAGLPKFPYQRSSNFDIDYGTENAATIASNENYIVWLSTNEKSGPRLMVCTGGQIKAITTDGIDFKLSDLNYPQNSFAFLFRQDGHLIYQLTFPQDNYSLIYDFNTEKFFTVTDENQNYHIARNVVFFNNTNYFVSVNDNNLYEFSTNYTSFQYSGSTKEIPRIRICSPIRLKNERNYVINRINVTVEQGQKNDIEYKEYNQYAPQYIFTEDGNYLVTENSDYLITEQEFLVRTTINEYANMCVDLSISIDGGQNFSNDYRVPFNHTGIRRNMLTFLKLGQMNDCSPQFKFWGFERFIVIDGEVEIQQ